MESIIQEQVGKIENMLQKTLQEGEIHLHEEKPYSVFFAKV
jgi:hypothetical protein